MFKIMGLFVLGLLLMAHEAMAQVFPVDAATTTTITSVKGDIVGLGRGVHRGGADDLRVQTREVVGAVIRKMGR